MMDPLQAQRSHETAEPYFAVLNIKCCVTDHIWIAQYPKHVSSARLDAGAQSVYAAPQTVFKSNCVTAHNSTDNP